MIGMAIKSIAIAGMGRQFKDDKQVLKLSTAYEEVRFEIHFPGALSNCCASFPTFPDAFSKSCATTGFSV